MQSKDAYVRIDGDDKNVIEPETCTKVPKFDLWLEGVLDYSDLWAKDKQRVEWLMVGDAAPSERVIET